jgi:hypothetical protein
MGLPLRWASEFSQRDHFHPAQYQVRDPHPPLDFFAALWAEL